MTSTGITSCVVDEGDFSLSGERESEGVVGSLMVSSSIVDVSSLLASSIILYFPANAVGTRFTPNPCTLLLVGDFSFKKSLFKNC